MIDMEEKFAPQTIMSDNDGRTPLHLAAMNKNMDGTGISEVIKMLIEYGADINALDILKKTPYEYALENPKLAGTEGLELLKCKNIQ